MSVGVTAGRGEQIMTDITDAIGRLTAALADLRTRLVAAGNISEHKLVRLALYDDGTGRITAGDLPPFGDLNNPLAETFAAAETHLGAPPFRPGELIVHRKRPREGHGIVVWCRRDSLDGGWRIESRLGPAITQGDAANYIALPSGWRDPPPPPVSHLARLELATDGPLSAEEIATARFVDEGRRGERAVWYREMAAWWIECGALVAPELAKDQARGFLVHADDLDGVKQG